MVRGRGGRENIIKVKLYPAREVIKNGVLRSTFGRKGNGKQ
jgi:hypothetical protein